MIDRSTHESNQTFKLNVMKVYLITGSSQHRQPAHMRLMRWRSRFQSLFMCISYIRINQNVHPSSMFGKYGSGFLNEANSRSNVKFCYLSVPRSFKNTTFSCITWSLSLHTQYTIYVCLACTATPNYFLFDSAFDFDFASSPREHELKGEILNWNENESKTMHELGIIDTFI